MPFIPHTDLNEQLNIYGDAPLTVSVSTVTVALATFGFGFKLLGNVGKRYVNCVGLNTFCTLDDML